MCSTPAIAGLTVQGASELPQVLVQNSDFWVPSWRLIQQVEGSPGIWILHKQLLMTDGGCFQTTPLARLPWWLRQKRVCLQCGRPGSHPWVGKIPWRRKCNPFQYSCLENPVNGGAWSSVHGATVHGVAESWTQLSSHTQTLSRAAPPQLGLWWLVPGRLRLAWAAWPSCTCPSPSVAKSASFLKPALRLSWSKWQDNLCPQLSSLDCLGLNLIFFLSSDTRGFWFQTYPQCLPRTGVMNCLVSQSGKRA